ncbi:MAG: cupin domain-containing protein [Patescibacteria group bacterium]
MSIDCLGEVKKIKDLVKYQEDAVVSRTLLNHEAGTVTLFAFGEGQGLSEHTAPYEALVYIIDGEALITIDGVTHEAKSGEIIILPADHPHSLTAKKPFKMMLTMVRGKTS